MQILQVRQTLTCPEGYRQEKRMNGASTSSLLAGRRQNLDSKLRQQCHTITSPTGVLSRLPGGGWEPLGCVSVYNI
jgi:hypothetical protein